jgi:hypothetical protein
MKEAKPLLKEVKNFFVRGFSAIWTAIKHLLLGAPEDLSKYMGKRTFISTVTTKPPGRSSE